MQSTVDSHNSELITEPLGKVEEDEALHSLKKECYERISC